MHKYLLHKYLTSTFESPRAQVILAFSEAMKEIVRVQAPQSRAVGASWLVNKPRGTHPSEPTKIKMVYEGLLWFLMVFSLGIHTQVPIRNKWVSLCFAEPEADGRCRNLCTHSEFYIPDTCQTFACSKRQLFVYPNSRIVRLHHAYIRK